MESSQLEKRTAVSSTKLLVKSTVVVILCVGVVVFAQAQDAQPTNIDESWTASTQTSSVNSNPSRTMESHTKSGNRSVDQLRVEKLGSNGRYQPDYETEKETVQVNSTTTRIVERTYRFDVNGRKNLEQVTEEDARSSASGDAQVVRTTSNSGGNGNLQVMQREVSDTRKTSPSAQETRTTFYRLDGNGGLSPFVQTQELQNRSTSHTVEIKKTTLVPDSSGNWQVNEVKESTLKEEGQNQTSEERVSLSDSGGRLSEVSRVTRKGTETAAGETNNTVETYSTEVPGRAPDGSLHLNQRVTTVQKRDSDGKTTEEELEQPNSGVPNANLQVSRKTKYIVQNGTSSTQQTKTIHVRDINGTFNVVSVEARKSDQVPAEQIPTAASDKAQ
jgi:hypothetical protein